MPSQRTCMACISAEVQEDVAIVAVRVGIGRDLLRC